MTISLRKYLIPKQFVKRVGVDLIVSPLDVSVINTQLDEIFCRQYYKKGRIKKDMVIIDAGANMGMASLYFRDWAKIIYALEPSPAAYDALVENTKQFSNIKPFNLGLADKKGTMQLKTNDKGNVPDSIFGSGDLTITVPCIGIQEFMQEQGIEQVDLLKIDVEGSECWVFESKGFHSVADKIDFIIGESHYFGFFTPQLMGAMLKESGFKTKFLPYNNYFSNIDYQSSGGELKRYHIPYQTIFTAQK